MSSAGKKFEDRVRRLARDYFDVGFIEDPLLPRTISGGEVDILYVNKEEKKFYLIEASSSRELNYIERKIKNTEKKHLELKQKYPGYTRNYWFVLNEPQNHQVECINKNNENGRIDIDLFGIDQFQQMVEKKDSNSFENWYLDNRINFPFGSARNPRSTPNTDVINIEKIEYLPCNIFLDNEKVEIDSIIDKMQQKNLSIVIGEYGLGKSLTLGNLFLKLKSNYADGASDLFPIFIDLKERNRITNFQNMNDLFNYHLTSIGNKDFKFRDILEKIENEKCILIFDGIDEVVLNKSEYEKKDRVLINSENLSFLKEYIQRRKGKQAIIMSVRSNFFFDFEQEIKQYFNIKKADFLCFELREFTLEEAKKLFELFQKPLPKDLPDLKPLLISKLAISDILNENDDISIFEEIVEYIIDREYSGHFASTNDITKEQFRLFLYEIASYAMTLPAFNSPIPDQVLIDIYNRVVKRSPSHEMERELKKLMLFRFNENETVSLYDEHIADSMCTKILIDISKIFLSKLKDISNKISYDKIIEESIEDNHFDIKIFKQWQRVLQSNKQELFEHLKLLEWTTNSFRAFLQGLSNIALDQLGFIILNSYYLVTSESDLNFKKLKNIRDFDTSFFTKFEKYQIIIEDSEIENISIHSTKTCFHFKSCMILDISFKDTKLRYKDELIKYNLNQLFDENCIFDLEDVPSDLSRKKINTNKKYKQNKEIAIFWCFKKIQKNGSLNKRYFYQNYQTDNIQKKDIDWALKKLVFFGFFSIFTERGHIVYKKELPQEINQALKNEELPSDFSKYFKEK
jgi:hypothetical protein